MNKWIGIFLMILIFGSLYVGTYIQDNTPAILEVRILNLQTGNNDYLVTVESQDRKIVFHTNKKQFDRLKKSDLLSIKYKRDQIIDVYK